MNKKIVIISTILLIIDQITKSLVELSDVHISIISNFFRINYYENTGAAFSILEGRVPILILISIVMLVMIYSMTFSYDESKTSNIAFGLLFGGVFGNLIDRVFCGFVRDFIDFKIFGYNFPVFNFADVFIVLGVILLLIVTIKGEKKHGSGSIRRRKLKNR